MRRCGAIEEEVVHGGGGGGLYMELVSCSQTASPIHFIL